jgi:hypothetical protein
MQRVMAGLFLAAVCAGLYAQTMNMRGTIPFAFRAGETGMPAGEYTIRHSEGQLVLRNEGGGPSVVLLTNAASRPTPAPYARLEFHRYGEHYFLSSIWTEASRDGREIPKSGAEKELARQAGPSQSAAVVLRRQ